MKLIAALLAALICLSAVSYAETLWHGGDEFYYHAYANCGGMSGRSEYRDMEDSGVCLCPVCCGDRADYESVDCVERGGTYVIRIPDQWIREIPLESVFALTWAEEYTGEEAEKLVEERLHGQDYIDFMEQLAFGGYAEGTNYVPSFLLPEGGFVMNQRHIGSCWYVTVRPKQPFDGKLYLRYFSGDMIWQDGTLTVNGNMETDPSLHDFSLNMKKRSGQGAVYSIPGSFDLYYEMDTWIGVFRKPDASECTGARLYINGTGNRIDLDGYYTGTTATFVCALTWGEAMLLQGGHPFDILLDEPW